MMYVAASWKLDPITGEWIPQYTRVDREQIPKWAVEMAARAWCMPDTEHRVMDEELAYGMARVIANECRPREDHVTTAYLQENDVLREQVITLRDQIMEMQDKIDNLETKIALKDL